MAVTNGTSTQLAATLAAMNDANELGGKLRVAVFEFTQGAAAGDATSTQDLCKLPSGKIRILTGLSRVDFSAFGAARTLNIGHTGFTNADGTTVAAAAALFASAVDVSAAGNTTLAEAAVANDGTMQALESKEGVTVQAAVAGGTIPAGATLTGFLVYVGD